MKKHDLTTKTKAELEQQLQTLVSSLAQMKFDVADKKLKRTSDIRNTRRQVARIKTALAGTK